MVAASKIIDASRKSVEEYRIGKDGDGFFL
jgi:hypothetical protein